MPLPRKSFSIAIPIGGWHPFFPAALRSLAIQEPRPNIAVMNSTKDARINRALDESGLDFTYRRDGPDDGQSAAIMEGWINTDSAYLGWLNVDDILLPGALKAAEAALDASAGSAAVYGGTVILDSFRRVIGAHSQVEPISDVFVRSNPISQPSCFFRRSAVERIGGLDTRLHYVMDWDLWVRLVEAGEHLEPIDEIWSAVFWGPKTKTSTFSSSRMREIFNLSQPRAGTFNALKTLLGVCTHGGPAAECLYRLSRVCRTATERSGLHLSASRHPGELGLQAASLRIPNAFDEPQSALRVEFAGARVGVSAPAAHVAERSPGTWSVIFDAPVLPGEDRRLDFCGPPRRSANFLSAQWELVA